MGRAASAGPWPREDPPVPAQGCGAVPRADPGFPVRAGLSQSAAGGRACRCWEGAGSATACTNSSLFLPLPPPKHWLTESAKLIAQSGQTVEWVTPMGLPIVQPYYRVRSTVVSVWWQSCVPSPVPLPQGGAGKVRQGWGQRAEGRRCLRVRLQSPQGVCVQAPPPASPRALERGVGCGGAAAPIPLRQLGLRPLPRSAELRSRPWGWRDSASLLSPPTRACTDSRLPGLSRPVLSPHSRPPVASARLRGGVQAVASHLQELFSAPAG